MTSEGWKQIRRWRGEDPPRNAADHTQPSRRPWRRRARIAVVLVVVSLVLLPTRAGPLVMLVWSIAAASLALALAPQMPRRKRADLTGEPSYDEDAWTRERVRRFIGEDPPG